jgi:hypothetical protein
MREMIEIFNPSKQEVDLSTYDRRSQPLPRILENGRPTLTNEGERVIPTLDGSDTVWSCA